MTPSTPSRRAQKTPSGRPHPNILGTVRREKSGRFRASYRIDGRTFSAPKTFDTERDAQAWLATEHGARKAGTWIDPHLGRVTLSAYARTWLAARVELAPRTRDMYEDLQGRWVDVRVGDQRGAGLVLGDYEVGAISTAVVRAWYGYVLGTARDNALAKHSRAKARQPHPARVWGAANGHTTAASGRMSPAVLAAWTAAGSPTPPPPPVKDELRQHAGTTSAARAYQLLRTLMNSAVDDGLIAANPCKLKGAGSTEHPERPVLTAAEVDQLAAQFPERLRAAVLVAAWSSLRYGELFALARRHVDLDAGTLRVERALIERVGHPVGFGPTKTTRSRRVVHLPGFVVDALRDHLAAHVDADDDALLFTRTSGAVMTNATVSAQMRRHRRAIGRDDVHWHDLRHTGATLAYRVGASQRDVMNRLGHTTTRAAAIYAHAADDSDQYLATRLDAAYRGTGRAA
ncbi:site-specific integrase [Microbacterium sp. AZCO]|uniref:site-specific integrase n=1 Tax=Microbacterium sp. AZCO TaxID=3142976 RepID=UPI0031F33DF2